MVKSLNLLFILIVILLISSCAPRRPGAKGPVRKAVEFPVVATDKGLDKSYSIIDKRIRLPGGNRAPMLERELPVYREGGSNISGLQHD